MPWDKTCTSYQNLSLIFTIETFVKAHSALAINKNKNKIVLKYLELYRGVDIYLIITESILGNRSSDSPTIGSSPQP
jgi:hypothetical protein